MRSRHFATTLRREMNARGWTQTELARRARCTQPAISQILSGRRSCVSLETAAAVASALGISLDRLASRHHRDVPQGPASRRIREWLLNPPDGSAASRARDFGIDLSLNAHLISMLVDEPLRFHRVLVALNRENVRYVVIGGVAMQFHASAILTRDLDIAYARDTKNIRSLVAALAPFNPKLRGVADEVPFRFDERSLSNGLNFTFITDVGLVDILGSVAGFQDFETLWTFCTFRQLENIRVPVLGLAGLIKAKTATARPKDRAILPELEALLEVEKKFAKR